MGLEGGVVHVRMKRGSLRFCTKLVEGGAGGGLEFSDGVGEDAVVIPEGAGEADAEDPGLVV